MPRVQGCEAVYDVADQWRDRCLLDNKSLLWPDLEEPTWTVGNIEAAQAAYRRAPEYGGDSWERLFSEIEREPAPVRRVMADVLVIWNLASWFPIETKWSWIRAIAPPELPVDSSSDAYDAVNSAFENREKGGLDLGNVPNLRTAQIVFYLEFAKLAKSLPEAGREPSAGLDLAFNVTKSVDYSAAGVHSLIHLLFPDRFEAVRRSDKRRIVRGFDGWAPGDDQLLEKRIQNLRDQVAVTIGRHDFQFFDPDVRELWSKADANAAFEGNYWLFQANPAVYDFVSDLEKLSPGDKDTWNVRSHKNEILPGDRVIIWISGDHGGIAALGTITSDPFQEAPEHPSEAESEWKVSFQLDKKLDPILSRDFVKSHPVLRELPVLKQSRGTNYKVTSDQWLALDEYLKTPERRIWIHKANQWTSQSQPEINEANTIFYPTTNATGQEIWKNVESLREGDIVLNLIGTRWFTQRAVVASPVQTEDGENYGYKGPHFITTLNRIEILEPQVDWDAIKVTHGDQLRELDGASFYSNDHDLKLKSFENVYPASAELIDILNAAAMEQTGQELLPANWPPKPSTLDGVRQKAFLEPTTTRDIDFLLRDKKQLIFEGPPGCGKTFLADLFARYLTGNPLTGEHDERMEFVQFHQSYGYEDFVQGIRPRTDPATGHLRYDVQDGIFLQMCDRARNDPNPNQPYVLVIDEINRGNLSRIFGELMMALEYRDKKVKLSYGSGDGPGETTYLTIPKNLYLIGTMNSTDRSLAMIDYALRRRFYFYPLRPVEANKETVLERWLSARTFTDSTADQIRNWFLLINSTVIGHHGDDFQVGHSYFMVDGIENEETRYKIWRFAIKPLLDEYYHGHKERDAAISACHPDRIWYAPAVSVSEVEQIADADSGF